MPDATPAPTHPTRERIIDAALAVMRERGLVKASVRAIVHEAGCSEALLYRYFADKQELFLAVLTERLLATIPGPPPADRGDDLAAGLTALVAGLMRYFTGLFPIAGSLFGAPDLLAAHRERLQELGGSPEGPVRLVAARLEAERAAGRIGGGADADAVARLLVGAAFQQGFLAAYAGETSIPDADDLARRLVAQVLPVLA